MSEIYQPNAQQQLQMLKEQTRLTGGLHEAQVLQLKMWPLVVFDTCHSSSFTWDPDKKVISFKVEAPWSKSGGGVKAKKFPLAYWKERVTVLNGWVQTLLGDEWMITVTADRKTYAGQRSLNVERDRPR